MNDVSGVTSGIPSNEDVLVIPDSWRRLLHPRRDGYRPRSVSKPVAGDGLTAESLAEIKAALDEPGVAPKLADAALAHLDGDANPLGAAVVATITIGSGGYPEKAVRMLDGWVAEHGLAFAACAFAESATLTREYAGRRWKTVRYAQQGDERYAWWAEERVARRLRTLLAVADEREYQEAVARLADHRRTPVQRVAVSYLVPTRLDWVEECRAHKDRSPAWMLLCSVSASHQLDLFAADPSRGTEMTLTVGDLYIDYSKHRITRETIALLVDLVADDAAYRGAAHGAQDAAVRDGSTCHAAQSGADDRALFAAGHAVPGGTPGCRDHEGGTDHQLGKSFRVHEVTP